MDKDPIREEAEKEACRLVHKYSIYEREDGSGDLSGNSDSMKSDLSDIIEKHLREKAELQEDNKKWRGFCRVHPKAKKIVELEEELTALRSHNLELVEALKDLIEGSNSLVLNGLASTYPVSYRDAEQVLSSPQSEKYLKMVKCQDVLREILNRLTSVCIEIEACPQIVKVIIKQIRSLIYEALKSYNSEKGGE